MSAHYRRAISTKTTANLDTVGNASGFVDTSKSCNFDSFPLELRFFQTGRLVTNFVRWSGTVSVLTQTNSKVECQAYSRADLAGLLKVSDRTVDRWIREGTIPGRLPTGGRMPRFSKTVVDAWLRGER